MGLDAAETTATETTACGLSCFSSAVAETDSAVATAASNLIDCKISYRGETPLYDIFI